MGLIGELLGSLGGKKSARTIESVEVALSRLTAERAAARESIARAMADRDALLLVDGSDAKISEADAIADRFRLVLERCDAIEPKLLAELTALRTEAKQARWRTLRSRYDAAAIEHASAMRSAVETAAVMLNINDEARSAGFEHETQASFIPPARMVSTEALNQFEISIERARELARPAPPPAPVAPPPKVVAVPKQAVKPAPVAVAPKPPPKPFTPPVPDEHGNVKITIIRPGLEIAGRARPRSGEVVTLPHAEAMRIVQSGHADFAEAS